MLQPGTGTRMMPNLYAALILLAVLLQTGGIPMPAHHEETTARTSTDGMSRHACTSFCLLNNGYAVFGANYDHGKNLDEGLVFVNKRNLSKSYWEESDSKSPHARWKSRYGSVTFNLVIGQSAWAGMNEAGLVISTMELLGSRSPAPDERPWIYAGSWVQYLLDSYSTVDEVVASDSRIRIRDYVDHYLVCDSGGNCAAIEFLDGRMVHHAGKSLPVRVLANNAYAEDLAEREKYGKGKTRGDSAAITNPLLRRFVVGAERAEAFEPTDARAAVEYAFRTLADVSGRKVDGSPTQWSLVFDTENLRVFFRTRTHPEIRQINLRELDFSCKTSVRMLDINAKLAGDITRSLSAYSPERHFDHAMSAYRKWGQGIDSETLRRNIRYLDSFPCEEE